MSAEIVGPFEQRRLVLHGWEVPFIQAIEQDGGMILFVVDGRLGYEVPAAHFEVVAELLADAIAYALGMPAFPDDTWEIGDARERFLELVPHFALRPRRVSEIVGFSVAPESQERK